jgi:putative transposase
MANDSHSGWRSRGYLPHLDVPTLVQQVVFRLADSLPAHLSDEIGAIARHERVYAIDTMLDEGRGRRDLAIPKIAELVEGALPRFDGERYLLLAWCVMPNHVHVLVETHPAHGLDRIVHSWKSFTAHAANKLLGRTASFWAPESFDRYMRYASGGYAGVLRRQPGEGWTLPRARAVGVFIGRSPVRRAGRPRSQYGHPRSVPPVAFSIWATRRFEKASISESVRVASWGCSATEIASDFLPSGSPLPS